MSTSEILSAVASKKLSPEQAAALLDKANQAPLRLKVSEKGAISVYGINRQFPVTLYAEQWERILGYADEIRAFAKANNGALKRKVA